MRVWQRVGRRAEIVVKTNNAGDTLEKQLQNLMRFLRNEVESEQRISLAAEGFNLIRSQNNILGKDIVKNRRINKPIKHPPTAAGLINCGVVKCIFCDGSHDGDDCQKAQELSMLQKKDILTKKGACFRCLKVGHTARHCRIRLKCIFAGKVMLP